jgi:hypothetical protein
MLALQSATATANLASQNAFLFLATHGLIFIASSSGLCHSNPVSDTVGSRRSSSIAAGTALPSLHSL